MPGPSPDQLNRGHPTTKPTLCCCSRATAQQDSDLFLRAADPATFRGRHGSLGRVSVVVLDEGNRMAERSWTSLAPLTQIHINGCPKNAGRCPKKHKSNNQSARYSSHS